MAPPGNPTRPLLGLALLAGLAVFPISRTPTAPSAAGPDRSAPQRPEPAGLDAAPPEVRAFLDRVLEHLPDAGDEVGGYRFRHWNHEGKPTREALGLKAIPGVDPDDLIARVMDVDGYEGHIAHVDTCSSIPDPRFEPPGMVRFAQRIDVPRVARVQQEAVLVDAGTIRGYRVAYWYLLGPETEALDPGDGARSEFSVGAWLAAPGVVGYAVSSWPRRSDVNAMQWLSLTVGADALATRVVEGTIDGMASWSREGAAGRPRPSPTP